MFNYVLARVNDRLGHRNVNSFMVTIVKIWCLEFLTNPGFFNTAYAAKAIFKLASVLGIKFKTYLETSCSFDLFAKIRLMVIIVSVIMLSSIWLNHLN